MKKSYLTLICAFSLLTPSVNKPAPECLLINPNWPNQITLLKTLCFVASLVGVGYCSKEADKAKFDPKDDLYHIRLKSAERNRKISYGFLLLSFLSIFCNNIFD